jgi:pilus assembly protein FimV
VADPSKSDPLSTALDNRLDELFREEEPAPAAPAAGKAKSHPLSELKKVVLSIDWEITPEALDSFLDQVRLLKEVYQGDKVILVFLQVLGSLGQYIRSSRSKVHPSTFNVLNSVFARLDEIVSTPKMPPAVRRKLLQAEMDAYQELRAKITQRRAAEPAAKPAAAAAPAARPPGPAGGPVTPEMLARAVAELKEFIRAETNALRQLMKSPARRD